VRRHYDDALPHAHWILRALRVLNILIGIGILALLLTSLAAEEWTVQALELEHAEGGDPPMGRMQLIMVAGVASVPFAHVVLSSLLAIVETVRAGDPFVSANGKRLQVVAWSVLVMEVLRLSIGAMADSLRSTVRSLDIHEEFSIVPWLAVLLLFVLARVFDEGARMRADLEGTV
jgi:hypothetical protein